MKYIVITSFCCLKVHMMSAQNTRNVEEIASAAEHMNKMAETLNDKLSEFRT